MSEFETEYRIELNKEKTCWELIRWDGEDQVIFSQSYGEDSAFSFKEAKSMVEKHLQNMLSIDPEEKVYYR